MSKTLTKWKGTKPDTQAFGFLYLIVNTLNGKLYVGRKQYHRWSKGKKGPESDWKTYKSSSKSLLKDIKKFGEDSFQFYIIGNAESRGELVYSESNFQHKYDCLTDKFTDNGMMGERRWYNGQIGSCKFIPKALTKWRIPKEVKEYMK